MDADFDRLMRYAEAHPEKIRAIARRNTGRSPADWMAINRYIMLDMEDLETVCDFTPRDWMAYGAMKEEEYEVGGYLNALQFDRVLGINPSRKLTFDLYWKMRYYENPVVVRIRRRRA